MEVALALDPGRTTGYALATAQPDLHIAYGETQFDHDDLWYWMLDLMPSYVVCESFDYRRLKDVDLYPCELIGVVNLFCDLRGGRLIPLYMQKPSVQGRDAYWSDAKLKELELYKAGTEHGRSALKHLLYWLMFGHGGQFGLLKPEAENPQFTGVSWFLENYAKGGDTLVGS